MLVSIINPFSQLLESLHSIIINNGIHMSLNQAVLIKGSSSAGKICIFSRFRNPTEKDSRIETLRFNTFTNQ